MQYTEGKVIGWGLRNSVGMDEDPVTGAIYSNENGSDDLKRDGRDIHENSPGEEINFHGYLNGTKYAGQGGNYGYPQCAASWNVNDMPRNTALKVGKQFYLGTPDANFDDATCQKNYVAPRLTLPSHWAPIDIKFNSKGTVSSCIRNTSVHCS
jgi:glucose/arabinose dehydrogenase